MYERLSVSSRSAWEQVEAWLQLMDRIILTTHLDLKPENKKVLLQKLKYSHKYTDKYCHKYPQIFTQTLVWIFLIKSKQISVPTYYWVQWHFSNCFKALTTCHHTVLPSLQSWIDHLLIVLIPHALAAFRVVKVAPGGVRPKLNYSLITPSISWRKASAPSSNIWLYFWMILGNMIEKRGQRMRFDQCWSYPISQNPRVWRFWPKTTFRQLAPTLWVKAGQRYCNRCRPQKFVSKTKLGS